MTELGFHDQSLMTSGFRDARYASPDSLIFTPESNFSLLSSASASVDRCSFASDGHDHDQDSLASEISLQLAGHERDDESLSGPDPDPNKTASGHNRHGRLSRKGVKAKVPKEDKEADTEEPLDSARNSFSIALKECQDRRSRSEALLKKPDRRRLASLDLNNASASSPQLGTMKKSSVSTRKSGTFPSPGTPNYRQASVGMQKGWSSERVPLHTNAGRRQVSAALLPFNNGRTLPSKWEDAERWIFSPIYGDGVIRTSARQPHRRPKSKSGPLGPPGLVDYSLYSPAMPMFEGGNFMAASPFSTGVIAGDGLSIHSGGCGGPLPAHTDPCMARSASVHGCSEMLSQSYFACSSQDEFKDAATNVSRAVSQRDIATQMSPEGSVHSSPKGTLSFPAANPSALSIRELHSVPSSKLEVRDVQEDEQVTVMRWSKKQRARFSGKGSENVDVWRKKGWNAKFSAWDVSETAKSISKVKREEAKITAWENLQKAKAEAAIQKLEMKLEKKRSSSMDKIMNKLKSSQKRAQEMRSSALANQAHQVSRSSHTAISFRRTRQMSSLSGCFTCHAF